MDAHAADALRFALALSLKATAVLGGTALLVLALRRASAAARHFAGTLGLAAAAALPLLTLAAPGFDLEILPAPLFAWRGAERAAGASKWDRVRLDPLREARAPRAEATPAPAAPERAAAPGAAAAAPAGGWGASVLELEAPERFSESVVNVALIGLGLSLSAALVWGLGALLLLARLCLGLWRVRRAALAAREAGATWAHALAEATAALGLRRPVRLLLADGLPVAVTAGSSRALVLLPAEAEEWSGPRRRVVLLHELAHVARGDWLSLLVSEAALALWWFHPLAWWLHRSVRCDAELAADDLVLEAGTRPSDYAAHLLALVKALRAGAEGPKAAMAMARSAGIEARLRAILDPARRRRAPGAFWRGASAVALAGFALVVSAARPTAAAPASNFVSPDAVAEGGGDADVLLAPEVLVVEADSPGVMVAAATPDGRAWAFAGPDATGEGVRVQRELAERLAEKAAERARTGALRGRAAADRARVVAELPQVEGDRSRAEVDRVRAEVDRVRAEADRAHAELDRARAAMDAARAEAGRAGPRSLAGLGALLGEKAGKAIERALEQSGDALEGALADRHTWNWSRGRSGDRSGDWYSRGMDLHRRERFKEAIEAFQKAIDKDDRVPEATYNIACGWARLGDAAKAIEWLKKAQDEGFDAASMVDRDDDFDEVRDDPKFRDLRKELRAARRAGNGAEAKGVERRLERMRQRNPKDPDAWYQLGKDALRADAYDAAAKAFQAAAERSQSPGAALYNTACALSLKGDKQAALDFLEKAIVEGFDDARLMRSDSDLEDVRDEPRFRELLAMGRELAFPGDLGSTWDRWGPFRRSHRREAAEELPHYQDLAKKYSKYGRAFFNLGYVQLLADRPKEAEESFQQALSRGYKKGTTLYNLACAAARQEKKDAAFDYLKKSIDAGFNPYGTMRNDEDLDNLRGDPRFRELMRTARELAEKDEDE